MVEGDLDHVVGVVHLKELLWALNDQGPALDLRALARPALLVPEMRLIQDLLLDFQKQKQHLALVVNEHGGIDGLVTLEDVLEELVGEIQDEFDREVIELRRTRGGAWLAQGTVTLEQLEDHLKLRLEAEAGSVSLGGFLQEQLGRILRGGRRAAHPGLAHPGAGDAGHGPPEVPAAPGARSRAEPPMKPALDGFILAAGLGTRMGPLSEVLPKPAWTLNGRSLLALGAAAMRAAGLKHLACNAHHLPGPAGGGGGRSLEVCLEPTLLGSAGGLRHARGRAADPLAVWNGDALGRGPLGPLHRGTPAPRTRT